MKRRERPKYEFLNEKWMQGHTWSQAGNALLHDLEEAVKGYEWVKTPEERRQYVLAAMVELGSQLLVTATRELREDTRLRARRPGKGKGVIDLAPLPNRPIEEGP